ncbi:MAG TPA: branched-chain amino acid ABC transporter permease [Candidatus Paceibacterota bacterium]|jgi:branched-chain amino acid transport system permease protein|nr:branched-chain amino acid ABC transporter permease [Candidatus Paceibacterota bacterium]
MVSWQIILYIISSGAFFVLLSMGFGFTLRSVKFFNLAYGGAFLVGGYMMSWFYRSLLIPFLPAILLSLLASGLYLLLSYKFIFSRLLYRKENSKTKTLVPLITSFGLLTATSAVIGMIFGNQSTFIPRHLSDVGIVNIFGATLNTTEVYLIIITFVIILLFAYLRFKTRFGRAVRAIEDDSEVAELVGIPKDTTLLKIFFISGVFAGIVGIIEGLNSGLIPASGLFYILPTIVAAVVGGMWSFWGGILGAFILAIVQQLTIVYFGGNWVSAVPFVILIIMLLVRPEGILKR